MHFRAKLKHVLWFGDLNASLINSTEIKLHLMLYIGGDTRDLRNRGHFLKVFARKRREG